MEDPIFLRIDDDAPVAAGRKGKRNRNVVRVEGDIECRRLFQTKRDKPRSAIPICVPIHFGIC